MTGYNDALAAYNLGAVHAIQWQNDGFAEDGVVTLPPGYDASKSYPLVLVIHGGPNSASITAFNAFNQVLAARGYIVFNPNYRGSDNLGAKYWYGIVNDSGAGPGRDVMAGIAAVEQAYKIDTSRIAVSGWSYGGYMTSWMIGHYHIWKAAVSGAAVNDLIDEYALADNGVGWRYDMNGSPYVERAHQELHRAIADQRGLGCDDADVDPKRRRRSTRADHAILQVLPRAQRSRNDGAILGLSGLRTLSGRSRSALDVYRRWSGWIESYLK